MTLEYSIEECYLALLSKEDELVSNSSVKLEAGRLFLLLYPRLSKQKKTTRFGYTPMQKIRIGYNHIEIHHHRTMQNIIVAFPTINRELFFSYDKKWFRKPAIEHFHVAYYRESLSYDEDYPF